MWTPEFSEVTALGCQSRLRQTGPALGVIVPGLSHRNKALFIKKKLGSGSRPPSRWLMARPTELLA